MRVTAKPWCRDLDDETAEAVTAWRLGVGVGVGDREDRDEVGDRAVADEPFRAVDDVVVAVARGRCPDRGDVGAGLGFGQGERDEVLPGRQLRDETRLLLGRAGEKERQRR